MSTAGLGEGDWLGVGMLAALDLRDGPIGAFSEACVCSWRNEGWFIAERARSRKAVLPAVLGARMLGMAGVAQSGCVRRGAREDE